MPGGLAFQRTFLFTQFLLWKNHEGLLEFAHVASVQGITRLSERSALTLHFPALTRDVLFSQFSSQRTLVFAGP